MRSEKVIKMFREKRFNGNDAHRRAKVSVNPFSLKAQNLQQPVKAQIDAQFKKTNYKS